MTGAGALSRADVSDAVRASIQEILPAVPLAAMTPDTHLRELGADSIDRVEIIITILDRLGVQTPMAAFSDLPDIGALVDFLWTVRRP